MLLCGKTYYTLFPDIDAGIEGEDVMNEKSRNLIASVSGVRGIVGPGINPLVAAKYSAAFASMLHGNLVVVGRDTRPSGPALSLAVLSTLAFMGWEAVDLGIVSTPTVEMMVTQLGASGGIVVTASHNAIEWNALKFLDEHGEFLSANEMERLSSLACGEIEFPRTPHPAPVVSDDSGDMVHIGKIMALDLVDSRIIASRKIKAVVDCVNGAASRILPGMLKSLGVAVVELNTDFSAPFPHDPEPRPSNLGDLSKAVAKENADLGFACDPDGDRLVLVDSSGKVCSEELTLALAADFVLGRTKGPLVANMSSSRVIDYVGRKHGVPVYRAKVGEANVVALMKECGAAIGGEGNGGVIYPGLHYGRDAILGAALVLQALADENISLAEKIADYPEYHIVKEKFSFEGNFDRVVEQAKSIFEGSIDEIDGIRIDMENGWLHMRRSNTEPVVRIIAEARSEEEARELVARASNLLARDSG